MITGFASIIGAAIILYFIQRQSSQEPEINDTIIILRMPNLFAWIGLFLIMFLTIILLVTIIEEGFYPLSFITFSIAISSIAILTFRSHKIVRYYLDDEKIIKTNIWGKQEEILLKNVKSVKLKGLWLPKVELSDQTTKLNCNPYLIGFRYILIKLKESGLDLEKAGYPKILLTQHNIG